ncbi:hypothetical protein BJ165DRAFT_438445 [Panaeolus papilionaceus]|nr:hypothetical protein BJ165DRAFT_438445 [Panaeolus papilionaceus]
MDLLPVLFTDNDSRLIGFISYEGTLILLSFLMLYLFAFALRFSKETFFAVVSENPVSLDLTTADGISTFCAGIIMLTGLTFMRYISLIPLLLATFVLRRYFEPSTFAHRLMVMFVLKYRLNRLIPNTLPTLPMQDIAERGVLILRSINHIILHVFALIVVPSMSVAFVGLSLQFFSGGVFMGLYILLIGLAIITGIVPLVMSMFRPFYRIRQTGTWRGEGRSLGFLF